MMDEKNNRLGANNLAAAKDEQPLKHPRGKSCRDCMFAQFCFDFLGSRYHASSKVCYWIPSRFKEGK